MSIAQSIEQFGTIISEYSDKWRRYKVTGFESIFDLTDNENDYSTEERRRHYYAIGTDALRIVVKALISAGQKSPLTILDFPSGSGRVTRHLRGMFPDALIGAADLHAPHTAFCAKHFDARPIQSKADFVEVELGQWDLIFCGSLLTHLPFSQFWPAFDLMVRSLNSGGIAIITLEGRRAIEIQKTRYKLIEDGLFEVAEDGYHRNGFGYVSYNQEFLSQNGMPDDGYGLTLVRPDWLLGDLMLRNNVKIISYTEGEWDDHQDVLVVQKA